MQHVRHAADPGRPFIVAESHAMRAAMAMVERAAVAETPVLIVGDTGTGKELLARALHQASPRAAGPFIAVNCSAIPEPLVEDHLFGHRRGAFTDAREDHPGLFQAAQRGTILLDEIGDLPLALQGKLLRVLQEKEIHALGALLPELVDVRVVAATHCNLEQLVQEGRFRLDLLYRVNVITIEVPPLRDRPEDIAPCVTHFLAKHGARLGRPGMTVSPEALAILRRHHWPGNVRELENVIERALLLASGDAIAPDDLPYSIRRGRRERTAAEGGRSLDDVEREHILRTLRAMGNKSAAARVLGLDRKTLYRKLKRLERPERKTS